MDVSHESHEIFDAVYWLAGESVLKKMAGPFILLVEIPGICHTNTLHRLTDSPLFFPYQQMYMIAIKKKFRNYGFFYTFADE